jgi:orotidine-5'-phosphate decarboxylase
MFDTSKRQNAAESALLPVPIVALDVSGMGEALALAERLPQADFVKVGLQLFSSAGPEVVRELRGMGRRVFLDLKLHDIPNTVAGAVEAAAALDVQLLTVHAAGGSAMMRAARSAVGPASGGGPQLMAVTVLTSLSPAELAETWGRGSLQAPVEAARLACLAAEAEMDGVVTSVHEVSAIRALTEGALKVLTPGIRFSDGAAGDQTRVATPAEAAALAVEYLVIGRAVTGASDPGAAFERLLRELERSE